VVAARQSPPARADRAQDQRVVINGVSWGRYVAIRELLEDHSGLRLTYLEGVLEITSPSSEHERRKKLIARLVETYAVEKRVPLNGYGSTTFRKEAKERGLEPDECYVLGAVIDDAKEVPDIAIEVVLTSGGIDKLSVYRGLRVPEVWFFENRAFSLFRLGAESYEPVSRSTFLPDLDLALLASFVDREDQTAAVLSYRDTIRA